MPSDFRLIVLPKVSELPGDLTFIEGGRHIPFDIKRLYYLYNVPEGMVRARHAHKRLHQVLIAISGAFDVILNDGHADHCFHLDSPHEGLYIPPMTWRVLENFSKGAVCMVLASAFYNESDYYREYHDFLWALKASRQ